MNIYDVFYKFANSLNVNPKALLDKGYYAHFTNSPSKANVNTYTNIATAGGPKGFYCYKWDSNLFSSGKVSFGLDRNFVIIIEVPSELKILDSNNYTSNNLDEDIKKLQPILNEKLNKSLKSYDKYTSPNALVSFLSRSYASPIGKLYYILSKASTNEKFEEGDFIDYSSNSIYDPKLMSELFLFLGYDGFTDHSGLIWSSEPEQTVLFNSNFNVVGIFYNPYKQ